MKPKPRSLMVLMRPSAMDPPRDAQLKQQGLACVINMPDLSIIGRKQVLALLARLRTLDSARIPHAAGSHKALLLGTPAWTFTPAAGPACHLPRYGAQALSM